MWYDIRFDSIGMSSPSSSNRNATITFFSSFLMASDQYVFLFSLSTSKASLTVFGTLRPYLGLFFFMACFCLFIAMFLFLIVRVTHQTNAGSRSISREIAYSAISTGFGCFTFFSGSQDYVPSHQSTNSPQPSVVIFLRRVPVSKMIHS